MPAAADMPAEPTAGLPSHCWVLRAAGTDGEDFEEALSQPDAPGKAVQITVSPELERDSAVEPAHLVVCACTGLPSEGWHNAQSNPDGQSGQSGLASRGACGRKLRAAT